MVPPCYDSMLAKIIVHGKSRAEAISRMKRALAELVIDGIETNIDFQYELMERNEILSGDYHTGLIEGMMNYE
jgi:acetyl-CoA carboxylase biotin carboxylase subunit